MIRAVARTALIAAIGCKPSFHGLSFTINHSKFLYGAFIDSLISFLVIALVIFFFVIKPVNALMALRKPETAEPSTRACPRCLSNIPLAASKCAFCTADIDPMR